MTFDQDNKTISAGLALVPRRRALSSMVGPKAAEEQVFNSTSLVRLCLASLVPPHPQDTDRIVSSDNLESKHAVRLPSVFKWDNELSWL